MKHLVTPLGFGPRTPILKVSCSNQAELRGEKTHIIELTIDVGAETIFNTLLYPIELKWTYPPMGLEPNPPDCKSSALANYATSP